jgi:hypothetical protein
MLVYPAEYPSLSLAGYQANTVFGASLAKIEYGTQNIPGQTKIIYKRETHSYRNYI